MKNKERWFLSKMGPFIICLIVSGWVFASSDQSGEEGITEYHELDHIIINNSDYKKDRKGPVPFPHRKHALDYQVSCWDCHHIYEGEVNEWAPWGETYKCIECHDPLEKVGNTEKLQTAYHLSCKKCHLEKKIFEDEPLAYRRCSTCHVKTSK